MQIKQLDAGQGMCRVQAGDGAWVSDGARIWPFWQAWNYDCRRRLIVSVMRDA